MSLTRNPDAVAIYSDADVYIGKTLTPTIPANIEDPFDDTWDIGGLMDGDAGVGNEREWDVTEHFAWGIGLYRKGYKNYKETRTFTLLEWNSATRRIVDPGSTATNFVVPRPPMLPLAFEFTNDFGVRERWFTARPADFWVPNKNRNESDPTKYEVTASIFANGAGLLYTKQYTPIHEAQVVTITGTPTGGAFKLGYPGNMSADIAYNANAAAVQTALVAVLGAGNVAVTGTGPYTVTLQGELAGQPNELLTATHTLTGGTSPGVTVEDAPAP